MLFLSYVNFFNIIDGYIFITSLIIVNKNLYLVWYLCKSKNILDVFDIISQFYPTQFIEINYN